MNKKIHKIILIACALALVISVPLGSSKAYAYTTSKVSTQKATINAQINTDGSILVHEQRIIDIADFVSKAKKYNPPAQITVEDDALESRERQKSHLNAVAWSFGSFPEESETIINDMNLGIIDASDNLIGNYSAVPANSFNEQWSGNDSPSTATCAFDETDREICMFSELVSADKITTRRAYDLFKAMTGVDVKSYSANKAVINFDYTIKKAPIIYKDVADFNWIYQSATWLDDAHDVYVSVTIPVGSQSIASPLGKVTSTDNQGTSERNIYAWGHGSSSGVVELDPAGLVTIKNDIVPGSTNASLHIVFPSAWLSNLDPECNQVYINQTKLSSILKDEQVWRDDRTDAVTKMFIQLCFIGLCIVLLLITLIQYFIYKSKFSSHAVLDKSIDQLNPSILARLKYYNHEHPEDIVESILHLINKNIVEEKRLPNGCYQICLNKMYKTAEDKELLNQLDKIDRMTVEFLFGQCCFNNTRLRLEDLLNYAKVRSKDFIVSYLTWHSVLTDEVNQLYHFKSSNDKIRHVLFGCSIALGLLSIAISIIAQSWISLLCGLFTALIVAIVANALRNKIYFKDEDGKSVGADDVFDTLDTHKVKYKKFSDYFTKIMHDSVLSAQDNLIK